MVVLLQCSFFFFFNDTATTEIYTLSLHDALPISLARRVLPVPGGPTIKTPFGMRPPSFWNLCGSLRNSMISTDRKSTRLNSSHSQISYAVFCLKKKKTKTYECTPTQPDATYEHDR